MASNSTHRCCIHLPGVVSPTHTGPFSSGVRRDVMNVLTNSEIFISYGKQIEIKGGAGDGK